jgi:endonuclease/exonuclease/phosphatase (EEP) superfamily protein YafD
MTGHAKKIFVWTFLFVLLSGAALMSYQQEENIYLDSLAVVTCNVEGLESSGRVKDITSMVNRAGAPDVVLLQGVMGNAEASFLAEKLGFPHYCYTSSRSCDKGLAILSNRDILNTASHFFMESKAGNGALSGDLDINGQRLKVVNLQLDRMGDGPGNGKLALTDFVGMLGAELFSDTPRSRSIEEVLAWVGAQGAPQVIVGGDFSSIPLSRAVRAMNEDFKDSMWPSFEYFKGTSRENGSPINLRTDYLFHSSNMTCAEASVIAQPYGHHHPVRAVFEINL